MIIIVMCIDNVNDFERNPSSIFVKATKQKQIIYISKSVKGCIWDDIHMNISND